jgi:hypothetical protein
MKLYLLSALCCLILMSSRSVRAAVVMDFESLRVHNNDIPSVGDTYVEDGFQVHVAQNPAMPNIQFAVIGDLHPGFFGSTALFPNTFARSDVTLTRVGGGTFNILSIDLIEHFYPLTPHTSFTGHLAGGGTISVNFNLDGLQGFQTFNFPSTFQNLESVTWTHEGSADAFRFDNITLALPAPPPPPAAPLPAAIFLAVPGIVVAGIFSHHQRVRAI